MYAVGEGALPAIEWGFVAAESWTSISISTSRLSELLDPLLDLDEDDPLPLPLRMEDDGIGNDHPVGVRVSVTVDVAPPPITACPRPIEPGELTGTLGMAGTLGSVGTPTSPGLPTTAPPFAAATIALLGSA